MGKKSKIIYGICIFLFTLYQYQEANLPVPNFDDLSIHKGKIVSAELSKSSRRSSCKLWVDLDSDSYGSLKLPCYGDYKEILSLVGKDAEIRTSPKELWGISHELVVWDVVVSGKHYYDYEFRKSNLPIAKSWVYWTNSIIWVCYVAWLLRARKIAFNKSSKRDAVNGAPS